MRSNALRVSSGLLSRTQNVATDALRRTAKQDRLIGHGLELAWHAVKGFPNQERPVAPPAQGDRVAITVVFGINLVERSQRCFDTRPNPVRSR